MWQSFVQHVKIQSKGISRIFFKKEHYEDRNDNLVKPNIMRLLYVTDALAIWGGIERILLRKLIIC